MGRSPCCDENGLKKGPWTPEEDQKLLHYIHKHGHGSWRALPKLAGLNRCGKSCRLRWTNYLRPDIKRGKFSQEEEQTILHLHSILGNKWSAIASHLPGRTDNEIKNFWNTHLKKKLIQMGFDPMTHQPIIRTDNIVSTLPYLLALANNITLPHHQSLDEHYFKSQAEALELANLQCLHYLLQSTTTTNSTNITNLHQEAFNFLTSFSNNNVNEIEKPVINCPQLDSVSIFSNNGMETAISQPLHHPNTSPHNITHPPLVSFSASHSCLNTDNNIQQASNFNNNNGELGDHIVNESSWIIPSPLTLTGTSPDSSTSTSSSHAGVTSSSSYWPELFFEDPFMPHLS